MKLQVTVILFALLAAHSVSAADKVQLKTQKDKSSYAIGVDMGNNLKNSIKTTGADLDTNILLKGIKDALLDGKLLMTDQELKESKQALQHDIQAKQQEKMKGQAEKNKKDGEAFLEENKKKDGIITLASGLQYKIIKHGSGRSPKATDSVTVNYRGTLIDGSEFDSSYKGGQPITFQAGGVIAGWTEALLLMKEGAKWQLFIPANLAYGERAAGKLIGPNSVLIFEIDLISISGQPQK